MQTDTQTDRQTDRRDRQDRQDRQDKQTSRRSLTDSLMDGWTDDGTDRLSHCRLQTQSRANAHAFTPVSGVIGNLSITPELGLWCDGK